jgi:hypothetical protein
LAPVGVRIVSLDTFADTEEEGAEAVLGDADNAVIPEAGDVMVYGDGGAGKTTLVIDLACHLAAGDASDCEEAWDEEALGCSAACGACRGCGSGSRGRITRLPTR